MPRENFTDLQKAQIYANDLATCAFSGKSLWLLDSGVAGTYMIDWADHIIPLAKGGTSTLENGVCSSWLYNYNKGTNVGANIYLFSAGLPTSDYLLIHDVVPEELHKQWQRFSTIHYSDWYFNRAIWRLCLGLCWLHDSKFSSAADRKRDSPYQAKASFNAIKLWQRMTRLEELPSLEARSLVPQPMFDDHKQLLRIREATSYQFILDLMQQLLPFHSANVLAAQEFRALYRENLLSVERKKDIAAFLRSVKSNKFITPIVKERMALNAQRLLMRL